MLDRAAEHVRAVPGGALVAPSDGRDSPIEAVTASLALALAAHQDGRTALARRLLRGAAASDHVVTRAGGEALFWLLAVGAYGAMGIDEPSATVSIDGAARRVTFERGRAVIDLPGLHAGGAIDVDVSTSGGTSVLARAEVVFGRAFDTGAGGPLTVEIAGDVGERGEVAALELTVAASERVVDPVIEVQLPSGTHGDAALLAALRGHGNVLEATERDPGFVRVRLSAMADETRVTLPLPLRWRAHGSLRGLGVVAYPAGAPARMSVIRPRALVPAEPTEPE
jgi:hypothetical protein